MFARNEVEQRSEPRLYSRILKKKQQSKKNYKQRNKEKYDMRRGFGC